MWSDTTPDIIAVYMYESYYASVIWLSDKTIVWSESGTAVAVVRNELVLQVR